MDHNFENLEVLLMPLSTRILDRKQKFMKCGVATLYSY